MTVADVLADIGWPVGDHGRTRCPLHEGQNAQAFSYTEDQWFCFAGCGGGGVRRLRELVGVARIPPPKGVVPQGAEFAEAEERPRRRQRIVFHPGRGAVTRRLTEAIQVMAMWIRDEWEQAHRDALCVYRDWEDLLRLIGPGDFEWIAEELGHALERLEATHTHLRSCCPGDCYLRDDPRPRH